MQRALRQHNVEAGPATRRLVFLVARCGEHGLEQLGKAGAQVRFKLVVARRGLEQHHKVAPRHGEQMDVVCVRRSRTVFLTIALQTREQRLDRHRARRAVRGPRLNQLEVAVRLRRTAIRAAVVESKELLRLVLRRVRRDHPERRGQHTRRRRQRLRRKLFGDQQKVSRKHTELVELRQTSHVPAPRSRGPP